MASGNHCCSGPSEGSTIANGESCCSGPGYASPAEAMKAEREKILYAACLYTGSGIEEPDYLATIDVDPDSPTYSQIIHRTPMPYVGDELHHFGWNACSSCHGDPSKSRRFLIIPGLQSSRIYVVDTADQRAPKLHKVIEAEEIIEKTGMTAGHTVHCLADKIMISMLGDSEGNGPGGFLTMDEDFNITGRWDIDNTGMRYNYDYWYQPRHNIMVSSEWAAPNTFLPGFNLEDVSNGKYGSRIHFWDWEQHKIIKSVELGADGLVPLETRFLHNPDSTHGYVGAALGSVMWHWEKVDGDWQVDKAVQIPPVELDGWPFPVPALITDFLISMNDKYMYLSNWLHGDVRQYDISDPAHPVQTAQVWLGGLLGDTREVQGHKLEGGPQMLQLSLDGRRLYVTNSLFSSWDNQFYPDMAKNGSYVIQINCDPEKPGMEINENFYVDFSKEPGGPSRAHEVRYPGGDCTSDIWL